MSLFERVKQRLLAHGAMLTGTEVRKDGKPVVGLGLVDESHLLLVNLVDHGEEVEIELVWFIKPPLPGTPAFNELIREGRGIPGAPLKETALLVFPWDNPRDPDLPVWVQEALEEHRAAQSGFSKGGEA